MAGDAHYDKVSLLLHFDGVNGATTVADKSPSPKAATFVGDAHLNTAQSVFGGASLLVDGAGDCITFADHSDFEFGSGDFFMQARVRLTGYATINDIYYKSAIISKDVESSRGFSWELVGTSSSWTGMLFEGHPDNSSAVQVPASFSFALNTWYDLAVGRLGNLLFLFVDGVCINPGGTAFNLTIQNSTTPLRVGALNFNSTYQYYLPAYIDELRITKGLCRASSDFTPASAPFPDGMGQVSGQITDENDDPAARLVRAYRRDTGEVVAQCYPIAADAEFPKVCLLIPGDYVASQTSAVDVSAAQRSVTAGSGASLSKVAGRYGRGSILFNGTNGYLQMADCGALRLGTGDFTIEFYQYINSKVNGQTLVSKGYGVSGSIIVQTGIGDGKVNVYQGSSSALVAAETGTVNEGQWYHVAVVRYGSTLTIYRDGVNVGSGSDSTNYNSSAPLIVGGGSSTGLNNFWFNGYMNGLRITKGLARYTSGFTPPSDRFPDRASGALGYYEFYAPTLAELTRHVLDDATADPIFNDIIDRVIPA